MVQHIAYKEFLPKVVGCEIMTKYDLTLRKAGYYEGEQIDHPVAITLSYEIWTGIF